MLQGTLDVFSLDEVLGLLSGANKSGVLNITGDRGVGSVSISDGQLVAGSASSAPATAWLSDVVFELMRYEEGSFSFDGGAEVQDGDPHELSTIMTEARKRLDEWAGIEAIVPSTDHHVSLAATLATSQVTLNEAEWAAIVAVGEGATVGVVSKRLGLGEFEGSKRIKTLVERSLASLEEGAPTPAAATAPVFETPEPAPMSFIDMSAADPVETMVFATEAPVVSERVISEEPVVEASLVESPVQAEAQIAEPIGEMASDFSFDSVAPEAPAFGDPERASVDSEIPPVPDMSSFGNFGDDDSLDAEIPPMPEPPVARDVFDTPPAPVASFGGFEPTSGADMFEPPRRSDERSTDPVTPDPVTPESFASAGFAPEAFGVDGFDSVDAEATIPPPPGAPANFSADPGAFGLSDAAPESEPAVEAGTDADDASEKGGSLLMRYLKSNG